MAVEKTYMLRLKAKVGADRRLVIELPPEMPTGEVELTVLSKQPEQPESVPQNDTPKTALTREEARAKLLAAGALVTWLHAPEDAVALTPEERMEIGQLPPGARPSEELVDEDRGEY